MKTLLNWEPESETFWKEKGRKIANSNLWASIPALFLAFATWMMWSIIIVKMQEAGFTLGQSDPDKIKPLLYTLPAIAGLAGATLRIPNSFLVPIAGGANVLFVTTALLLVSVIGTAFALQDPSTPYMTFAILAVFSGIGGGNFSSSMANISGFFPKKAQGTALGLNAGLGNLGVSAMQFLLPITLLYPIFGGGFLTTSNGVELYLQNAGYTWIPLIIVSCLAIILFSNNLQEISPSLKTTKSAFINIFILIIPGLLVSFLGAYLLVFIKLNIILILIIAVALTLFIMKVVAPAAVRPRLDSQLSILKDKHNWIMTIIYVMTFGSFIGYAASFPKLIQDVFGQMASGEINPNAPSPMTWAWLGPFIGAILRPVGGWLSDKINSGSKVTTWSTIMQVCGAMGAAFFIKQVGQVQDPNTYWWPFFACFMLLFIGSGIGNGSTFRSIPYIFTKEKTSAVLGWTAAIGAYGSFLIPKLFGEQIANKTPEYALYGFTIYYIVCLILNWYYYDRKNAPIKC